MAEWSRNPRPWFRQHPITFLLFLVCGAGCSGSPATSPSVATTTTVPPSAPTAVSLAITNAPESLPLGESVQLTARASLSDGTSADVTDRATWESTNLTVATVSTQGRLTVVGIGEAAVRATYQALNTSARVSGAALKFTITGVVHEAAPTSNVLLGGARVEVVGGPMDGQVFISDRDGRFRLPPVASPGFTLNIKAPDYEDAAYAIVDLPRDLHPDIGLMPTAGELAVNITGLDVCSERAADRFFPNYMVMAEFPVYHDGFVRSLCGPVACRVPFSIGIQTSLYRVTPDGRAERMPGVYLQGFRVQGGHHYYYIQTGDVTMCRTAYYEHLVRPR